MATLPPSFLGTQPKYDPIYDKAKFEKELNDVFSKSLQNNEAPIKEKHIRSATISTWREKGCPTFWKCIRTYPQERSGVVCYKSCYMIHKMLRDGYPDNAKRSATNAKYISELAKHWNQLGDPVSKMITSYLKVVWNKIAFHVKNPEMPCTLNFTEKPFVVPNDIDYVFQLTVEVFDYQSSILHFYAGVIATLSEPLTAVQVQYRIAPFVPCIKESAALYDLVFKLMKALHTSLPADTLGGHRERFNRQYLALRKYFAEAAKRDYVKKFVDVPVLPADPPNFLIGSFDELHLSNTVFSHEESRQAHIPEVQYTTIATTVDTSIDSRSRLGTLDGTLVDLGSPITEPVTATGTLVADGRDDTDSRFNSAFGQRGFDPFVPEEAPPTTQNSDERDLLIEQLMREIVELKDRVRELEEQNMANLELLGALRTQMEEKNKELLEYKEVAEQACTENVQLKEVIETERSMAVAQTGSDEKTKAVEQKFTQLKDIYQKLRNEHIQLLRTNGETQKKLNQTETKLLQEEEEKTKLEESVESLNTRLEVLRTKASAENTKVASLEQTLRAKEVESIKLQESTSLLQEQLEKSEQSSTHSLLIEAIEQAEAFLQQVMGEMEKRPNEEIICIPDFLIRKVNNLTTITISLQTAFASYLRDPSTIKPAISFIFPFTSNVAQIIQYGISDAPADKKVTATCNTIGKAGLLLFNEMKQRPVNMSKMNRMYADLKVSLRQLELEIEDLKKERMIAAAEETVNVGDIVDEEMANTSLAIDEAAKKIEEILRRSREEQSGVSLEVNSRILDSCTELMKAIQVLILRSKELQQEIVTEGAGAASNGKEFYKKHHNWSEGLISAAKQVGHGASRLVDCADKVVSGDGKFEALIVNSKDIAASTAQLVAASMVKARARSERLKALKASSRAVSEATGTVVASAQSGADIKAEATNKIDFSKLSLNQTKRYEMESQVRALELEKELEMERAKLAELRKIHYHKAGASEGWDEEEN